MRYTATGHTLKDAYLGALVINGLIHASRCRLRDHIAAQFAAIDAELDASARRHPPPPRIPADDQYPATAWDRVLIDPPPPRVPADEFEDDFDIPF